MASPNHTSQITSTVYTNILSAANRITQYERERPYFPYNRQGASLDPKPSQLSLRCQAAAKFATIALTFGPSCVPISLYSCAEEDTCEEDTFEEEDIFKEEEGCEEEDACEEKDACEEEDTCEGYM
jgi:hypothetical protein